jgi:F0F1-type ATP synthase alpha subunit
MSLFKQVLKQLISLLPIGRGQRELIIGDRLFKLEKQH